MTAPQEASPPQVRSRWPVAVAVAAAVCGAVLVRWIFLAWFGSELPFWDQWNAEIDRLLLPFDEGRLTLGVLLEPHNEHRIVLSRLLGLALFVANEHQFDNLVAVFVNAVLYAFALAVVALPVFRRERGAALTLSAIVFVAICASIHGWQNSLIGMQSAFYLTIVLTIGAVSTIALSAPSTARITATCALALAAALTMLPGMLTAPAAVVTTAVLLRDGLLDRRAARRLFAGLSVIFAITVALYLTTPPTPSFKARDVAEFLTAFGRTAAWPFDGSAWFALVAWLPLVAWSAQWLRRRGAPSDADRRYEAFLAMIAVWALMQAAVMAYARGRGFIGVASRYSDILIFGVIANALLARQLIARMDAGRGRDAASVAAIGACVAAVVGLGLVNVAAYRELVMHRAANAVNRVAVRAYVGGDTQAFDGKSAFETSHPNRWRVEALLRNPTVRAMLPASVRAPLDLRWDACALLHPFGAYPSTPARPDALGTYSPQIGNANRGTCVSAPVATRFSHVTVRIAGYLGEPDLALGLDLSSTDGTRVSPLQVPRSSRERWLARSAAVPATPFVVRVTDATPDYWFAFAPPTEQGRLSAAAERLREALRRMTSTGDADADVP